MMYPPHKFAHPYSNRSQLGMFLVLLTMVGMFSTLPARASDMGRETGLPIPRFVSLKSSEINMRKGPGTRYPIVWVYRRDRLPVEIIEEFEHWRQIRDHEGAKGWLHKNMLSGARTVLITAEETLVLKDDPKADADSVVKLQPGVIASLRRCEEAWCKIEVADHEGWLLKKSIYGAYDKELYKP